MSRLVLFSLWGAVVFGFLVAAGIGIAAGDLGMVQGAAECIGGGRRDKPRRRADHLERVRRPSPQARQV